MNESTLAMGILIAVLIALICAFVQIWRTPDYRSGASKQAEREAEKLLKEVNK